MVSLANGESAANAQRDRRFRAFLSRSVVVGEIKCSVSEMIPASNIPAISGGAERPASAIRSVTSVEVLPTGTTVKWMGELDRKSTRLNSSH